MLMLIRFHSMKKFQVGSSSSEERMQRLWSQAQESPVTGQEAQTETQKNPDEHKIFNDIIILYYFF